MEISLVSVMIPAYNAENYIGDSIESLMSQNYKHWELIIVNDGSQDRTEEIAARYVDSRIKLINQPNSGEATARNTALDNMQGDFVAFLDADDKYLDNHLQLTMEYLHAHPHQDGVYTDGYYCDEKLNPIQTLQSWRRGPFEGYIFEEVVRSSDVFGPPVCVVLKRDLIEEHCLRFDPDITIGPDWDFLTRYSAYGDFGYLDEITCCYRLHQTNVTVRTGSSRRSLDLAKCRTKAINLEQFDTCSPEVKSAVFYDLLVNLLKDFPERQSDITKWEEFRELPVAVQANLYRLMASNLIIAGVESDFVKDWLEQSRKLNPNDWISLLSQLLYKYSPELYRRVVQLRRVRLKKKPKKSPFGNRI